jgi:hypothetical protein
MSDLHYYVCDNCGHIADISEGPHPANELWACADCESTALWEFTDKEKARTHAFRIMDARHAARMAGLDQARAGLEAKGNA